MVSPPHCRKMKAVQALWNLILNRSDITLFVTELQPMHAETTVPDHPTSIPISWITEYLMHRRMVRSRHTKLWLDVTIPMNIFIRVNHCHPGSVLKRQSCHAFGIELNLSLDVQGL
jgi:hypothetical protein